MLKLNKNNKILYSGIACTAFTLAEVLITLAVIGVVAAMSIPGLINNIDKAQYKTALRKNFAEANAVFKKIATDRGNSLTGYSNVSGDDGTRADDFKDMILPYVSYTKHCNTNEGNNTNSECKLKAAEVYNYDGSVYSISGWSWGETSKSSIVLSNGAIWYLFNYDEEMGTCSNSWISGGPLDKKACGIIFIDTNGLKKPNKTTEDIWEFYIAKDGTLVPLGSTYDRFKDAYSNGHGYTAALEEMLLN